MYMTLVKGYDEYVTHNGKWITLPGSILRTFKGNFEVIAYNIAKSGIDPFKYYNIASNKWWDIGLRLIK